MKKHKKLTLLAVTTIVVIIILVAPIIPIQITPTKITREIDYIPEWHGPHTTPMQVDVKNIDLYGGNFSITIKWLKHNFINETEELLDISRQSAFIPSKTTHNFFLPEDWEGVISDDLNTQGYVYSFVYEIKAPIVEDEYDTVKTEYKSIISLITNS